MFTLSYDGPQTCSATLISLDSRSPLFLPGICPQPPRSGPALTAGSFNSRQSRLASGEPLTSFSWICYCYFFLLTAVEGRYMRKCIPGNKNHLTLKDRNYIEDSLNQGRSFQNITRYLCKDPTTFSKEVKAHRIHEKYFNERLFYNVRNFCVHRSRCRKTNICRKIELCNEKFASCPTCNQTCPAFESEYCSHLQRAPYVC